MNLIDRAIGFFAPGWAVNRYAARATLEQIQNFTGGGPGGYQAGKLNRLVKLVSATKENGIPIAESDRLRANSWDLYRNNTYARKIVRSLESKVIGKGMTPDPQTINDDGTPNVEFRKRAKELWESIQSGFDIRGRPGKGGLTFPGLQRLALRSTILSGNVLTRLVPIVQDQQQQRDIPIPVVLQLIDSARLADVPSNDSLADGSLFFRGVELDEYGQRRAYWINSYPPGAVQATYGTAKRIPAEQIQHLFIEEDIDQIIGTPWFAAAILNMRDTGDLQYNVLKGSAMAACAVLGYRKPKGKTRFGLAQDSSSGVSDVVDDDGNAITKMQPGMVFDLGTDGDLKGFSPNQQNLNPEAFVQHMLRGTAAGIAGIKSSTVTGDYRQASFSSEAAADNDTWPEIGVLQEWFATSFCQPIYEAVIRAGVLSGWFTGVVSADEFAANPGEFTKAAWQGPVSLSINPKDDIAAATLRIQGGLSSVQQECSKMGTNWRQNLIDAAELYEVADELEIPQEVVNNIMGVGSQDVIAQAMANPPEKPATDTQDPPADSTDTETPKEEVTDVAAE